MSATVSKMLRGSKARGHSAVGNWITVDFIGKVRARDQFGVH